MVIYEKYYTDDAGQQYRVSISYQRDGRPRGYYVSIIPCKLEDAGSGILSCATRLFDPESVFSCIQQVTRASKKAERAALDQLETIVDIYFAPRGVAFVGTAWETIQYAEHPETMAALKSVFNDRDEGGL